VRLRPYGIKPKVIRIGGATPRGYRREDFEDAWVRYLPLCLPDKRNKRNMCNRTSAPAAYGVACVALVAPLRGRERGATRLGHKAHQKRGARLDAWLASYKIGGGVMKDADYAV
jgi:hypothetical protein